MTRETFEVGDKVIVTKIERMPGNSVAPLLEMNEQREVKGICIDEDGFQHLDVGLVSSYNYIRSYETDEELKDGDKIHWCHPSRFKKVNNEKL